MVTNKKNHNILNKKEDVAKIQKGIHIKTKPYGSCEPITDTPISFGKSMIFTLHCIALHPKVHSSKLYLYIKQGLVSY